MDYAREIMYKNDIIALIPTLGLQAAWIPHTPESNIRDVDVSLTNLKRAYNLSLENIGYPEVELKTKHCEENDSVDEDHSIKFCKSLIEEEEGNVSALQNNNQYHCKCSRSISQSHKNPQESHIDENLTSQQYSNHQLSFVSVARESRDLEQDHGYCKLCNSTFKTQEMLEAHHVTHNKNHSFKCVICKKVFLIHRHYIRHIESHENNLEVGERLDSNEEIHKCVDCQKVFTKKESLMKHVKIHSRDSLKCSLCEFTCEKKVMLKMHVISHEGNRKYKCSHCDYSFKQIGHLKRHIRRFNH